MSIFGKLKFWKKHDDFEDLINQPMPQDNLGLEPKPPGLEEKSPFENLSPGTQPTSQSLPPSPFQTEPTTPATPFAKATAPPGPQRDLELISSKLDTIKALLQSLDQRIGNLEKGNQPRQKLW